MHEKCFKITFFANFRKLQKKLPICKKKFAEILNVARAVVTNVEKKSNRHNRIFLLPQKSRQAVVVSLLYPPRNKMGSTRLNFLAMPKKFCDFGPVNEKTRLNLPDIFRDENTNTISEQISIEMKRMSRESKN